MVPRTEATGVFLVRLRTVFRSGFRLDPVKSWRSESSTSCMNVSSFQRMPGLADQLVASQEDSARKRGNVGGKVPEIFSTALFRRPVFTCVVDVAPDVGFRRSWYRRKACATYFSTVQALHRGELGFARYDLANRRPLEFLPITLLVSRPFLTRKVSNRSSHTCSTHWSRGGQFDSVFGLVNGPVKPWSNLVNLGQTWSNSVKHGQSSLNSGKCIPDHVSRVFGHSGPQSGQKRFGQPLVKLGQLRSNLVNPGQTWSNLWEMCPKPSFELPLLCLAFLGTRNVGQRINDSIFARWDFLGFRAYPQASDSWFSLENSTFPTSAFSFPSSSDLALRKSVRPFEMSHRGSGSGDRRRSSRLGFLCHASSIEVVVALSAGSECTRIPYFRLSYLVEFLIPEASILSPIWEILQEVSIRLDDVDLQWPRKSASVSTSMSAECVYDERFPSNFLKLLNTTHGFGRTKKEKLPQYQG
uniref:Uncharacterized protein n=1 Tax=Fagus sylvatica TaxID=28930 RepID=A0A2N9I3E8_FAGSY